MRAKSRTAPPRKGKGLAVRLYMFEHCSLCFRVRMRFPDKVRGYFETMMVMIGYQPLAAV